MGKSIMIFSPVHQREWILPYYLRNIYDLDYDKKDLHIFWLVNNCTDKSFSMLEEFKKKHLNEYGSIKISVWNNSEVAPDDRLTETREKGTYHWLPKLRNRGTFECLQLGCDYLLSIDSDVLVKNDLIKSLMSRDKDYVSALLYNGYLYKASAPHEYPNVLRQISQEGYQHLVTYKTKNKKGLTSCDFTGAVFLCSKKALPFLKFDYHKLGEDLPACQSLQKEGFELFCSCDDYCQHIMSKDLLEQFKNFPNY